MNAELLQGRLKFFCQEKGYGFIRKNESDIFLHATELPAQYQPLPGDLLEFFTKKTRKGVAAVQIKFISRSDKFAKCESKPRLQLATPKTMQKLGGVDEQRK